MVLDRKKEKIVISWTVHWANRLADSGRITVLAK